MKLLIEFADVDADDREGFADHIQMVADALHSNETVGDVSIGAEISSRRVTFELSVRGETKREAVSTALAAIVNAIRAAGGRLIDPILDEEPVEVFEDPLTEPLPNVSSPVKSWHQHRIELVDA